MHGNSQSYSFIVDDMNSPDPYNYLLVCDHEGIARSIAEYLDLQWEWQFVHHSKQINVRHSESNRIVLDLCWLYKTSWSRAKDDIAEALMRWRARHPRTIRLVNSDLIHRRPPRDILQESKISDGLAWQHEPSQDWTVQNSRSLLPGSQVHFSEDSRGDLQRCFTYDGQDVSHFIQRAESRRLMDPRRRFPHEDFISSKASVQSISAATLIRHWLETDCRRRGRKKK